METGVHHPCHAGKSFLEGYDTNRQDKVTWGPGVCCEFQSPDLDGRTAVRIRDRLEVELEWLVHICEPLVRQTC